MSKQKTSHTPGPWEVFESHTGIYILDSAEQAAVCKLEWCLEAEANARLIASAPELLALLRRICYKVAVCNDGGVWREARATIDKVEGRAAE